MDPSQRAFLFNQMMQALELGNKEVADKIEFYLRNFDPTFPVPISLFIPSDSDTPTSDFTFSSNADTE